MDVFVGVCCGGVASACVVVISVEAFSEGVEFEFCEEALDGFVVAVVEEEVVECGGDGDV